MKIALISPLPKQSDFLQQIKNFSTKKYFLLRSTLAISALDTSYCRLSNCFLGLDIVFLPLLSPHFLFRAMSR